MVQSTNTHTQTYVYILFVTPLQVVNAEGLGEGLKG